MVEIPCSEYRSEIYTDQESRSEREYIRDIVGSNMLFPIEVESRETRAEEGVDTEDEGIIVWKPYCHYSGSGLERDGDKSKMENKEEKKRETKHEEIRGYSCYLERSEEPTSFSPDQSHHKQHHENIPHHIIGDEPERTILYHRKKSLWKYPRKKCKSSKKTHGVVRTEKDTPKK